MRRSLPFLAKLLLFVLPPLALLGWLEFELSRHPEGLEEKALAWKADSTAQVLVLGSSHAWYGLDPAAFSRPAHNLAYVSQTLYFDSALLASALKRTHPPTTVVQVLSPFSLIEELDRLPDGARSWSYARAFGIAPPASLPLLDSRRFSRVFYMGNWRAVKLALRGFRPDARQIGIRPDGGLAFHPARDTSLAPAFLARRRRDEWRSTMQPALLPVQKARLRALLSLCRSRGVRMVLVRTPLRQELSSILDPGPERDLTAFLDTLSRSGTEVLDFSRSPDYGPEDFVDMDHLGRAGSQRFTRRLDSLLFPPLK